MPVTYAVSATALNRLQVALGANPITPLSGQSVDAAGGQAVLQIWTVSLGALLVSFTLLNPSFSFIGRTATLKGTPLSAAAGAAGIAAAAQILDSNGIVIISGLTVGAAGSGADIIIGSTTVTNGETVTIVSGTLNG